MRPRTLAMLILLTLAAGCASPDAEPAAGDAAAPGGTSTGTPSGSPSTTTPGASPAISRTTAAGDAPSAEDGACRAALEVEEWDVELSGGYRATISWSEPDEGFATQTDVTRNFTAGAVLPRPIEVSPGMRIAVTSDFTGEMTSIETARIDIFDNENGGEDYEEEARAEGYLGGSAVSFALFEEAGACRWGGSLAAMQEYEGDGQSSGMVQTLSVEFGGVVPDALELRGTLALPIVEKEGLAPGEHGFEAHAHEWEGEEGTGTITYAIVPYTGITPLT